MPRKINPELLKRFNKERDERPLQGLKPLLDEINKDINKNDFSIESRIDGQAVLYYRKSKAIIFKAKGGIIQGDKEYGNFHR